MPYLKAKYNQIYTAHLVFCTTANTLGPTSIVHLASIKLGFVCPLIIKRLDFHSTDCESWPSLITPMLQYVDAFSISSIS
jgi:hypothetical protein